MIVRIRMTKTLKEWLLLVAFYLLVFQLPLSGVHEVFSYIDEIVSVIGIVVVGIQIFTTGKIKIKKLDACICAVLVAFIGVGLVGNAVYEYQPMYAVLVDVYTNIKFFFSIVTGYVLFSYCEPKQENSVLVGHARIVSVVLFALTCLDLVFHIFPSWDEVYGLRTVQLFFIHETYLAGAMVFLLTILLAFYEQKNLPYMLFSLIVLVCTLKGKAFAGAVTYILLAYFLVYRRKKIKLIHILVILLAALLVAGGKIKYYFVELEGESARWALTTTSFQILRDYFPIGTGFGTYGSATAIDPYSPVYYKYGLNLIWGLSEKFHIFASDTFWPIIFGQTGFLGTVCFVAVLVLLFVRLKKIRAQNIRAYAAALFGFAYIMICSTAEPAFHNSISVPLAMMMGYAFTLEKKEDTKCLKN